MPKYGFGRRFHDLKYLEVDYFYMFLEFTINLRASYVKKNQFNVILSYFKQLLVQYNLLAHHLQCLLKYVDFS